MATARWTAFIALGAVFYFGLIVVNGDSPILKAVAVDAVGAHSVAIGTDGQLWGWYHDYSVPGDRPPLNRAIPGKMAQGTDWVGISAGWEAIASIKKDGSLWIWGSGTPLWNDTTLDLGKSPVPFTDGKDWKTVAAGNDFFIALKTNGTLWTWGGNRFGQLGLGHHGKGTGREAPGQIGADTNWVQLAARIFRATALKSDGTLWAWGWNTYGELGDGSYEIRNAPVQVGVDKDWVSVHTGNDHTLAIKKDGSLWARGENREGQLGDGTKIKKSFPVKVGTDNNWLTAGGGRDHTLAIKKDGTLWAWGLNNQHQLGDGTTNNYLAPTQIGSSSDWTAVAAGEHHSLGIKRNGKVYAWGNLSVPRDGKLRAFWHGNRWVSTPLNRLGITYQSRSSLTPEPQPVYMEHKNVLW